jgi:hypothetical protein
MSVISATTSLPASSPSPAEQATEPAVIRTGDQKAKDAYQTGIAFENLLISQLAQQMTATVPGLDGSDDGLGGTNDSEGTASGASGGLTGGLGAYASLLPQTLATSVMNGGGTGVALQIARSIDPGIGESKK